MKFSAKSDKGLQRDINEDSYNILAGYSEVPVTFIIADGMGGHNSGEIASKMAVEFVSNYFLQYPDLFIDENRILEALQVMVGKANSEIYNASLDNEANKGMGTTLTFASLSNQKLYIGHIGDSRLYVYRNASLKQLTTDHTYIEELCSKGTITREEAEKHPKKHILTRALGSSDTTLMDTYLYEMRMSDIFLLCTDGLTNMVSEKEIMEIIKNTENIELATNELINRANINGGEDNITAILFTLKNETLGKNVEIK